MKKWLSSIGTLIIAGTSLGSLPIIGQTQINEKVINEITDKQVADTLNLIKIQMNVWNEYWTAHKIYDRFFQESSIKAYLRNTPEIQEVFTYSKFNVQGIQFYNAWGQWKDIGWDVEMIMLPGFSYRWKYDYGTDTNRLWEFYTRPNLY